MFFQTHHPFEYQLFLHNHYRINDDDENHPLEEIEGDHQSLSQEHTERRMQEIIDKEKSGD